MDRDIFNISFMMNRNGKVSPYVVLLCNKFKATVKDDRLRVWGRRGTMTERWGKYVEDNASAISADIKAINEFFSIRDDGMEVD